MNPDGREGACDLGHPKLPYPPNLVLDQRNPELNALYRHADIIPAARGDFSEYIVVRTQGYQLLVSIFHFPWNGSPFRSSRAILGKNFPDQLLVRLHWLF